MRDYLIRKAKLLYSSSLGIGRLVKAISSSKIYLRILKTKIINQIHKDKKGPFNLSIETTNFCNACCSMCPYRLMKRPKKIMDEEIFSKIVRRIKKEKICINKILLSGLGEPLTDPNFISRIKKLKNLGFPIRLYTNASLLTKKIAKELVKIKLDEINISFNGVTPKQYKKIMGLDFDKTIKNIDNLLEIKKEQKSKLPVIQISSIITPENEVDIKKHIKKWSGKVSSVTVSQPHEWGGGVKMAFDLWPKTSNTTYPCRSLWHTFVIDSQGNFVICCRDYESKYILGNIKTDSFSAIQNNPLVKKFRRLHLQFQKGKLPQMCRKCNFPYQDGIEWFMPRSID